MAFSSGSYDFDLFSVTVSPKTNQAVVSLALFDQTDGRPVGLKSIICPLDGVSPVVDGSRVLANQAPVGIITPSNNLLTNVLTALSGARDNNKLRP